MAVSNIHTNVLPFIVGYLLLAPGIFISSKLDLGGSAQSVVIAVLINALFWHFVGQNCQEPSRNAHDRAKFFRPLSPRIYGAEAERIIAFFLAPTPNGRRIYFAKMRAIQIGGYAIPTRYGDSTQSMDKGLIERVRELQCEVAQIAAALRGDMPYRKGDLEKQQRYERRLDRLQEIKEELSYLFRRAA